MGVRSRRRRARRAWLVPLLMPLLNALSDRVRKARPRAAYRFARMLAVVFRWIGFTRSIVRRNLSVACGRDLTRDEHRRFERRYYDHLALLIVEFLRQPNLTRERLPEQFDLAGLRRVKEIYDGNRGVIFVTGHVGVWELTSHAAGLFGVPVQAVVKTSGYPQIDAWVAARREAGGASTLAVKGSLWGMKKALDRGVAIGILVDQEVRQGMTFAPFFGVEAATSSAPALLHRLTGAPIVVVSVLRHQPFRYSLEVLAEIEHPRTRDKHADMLAITSRINAALADGLRRYPEQWLWSHRRWRRRPEGEDPANPFPRVDDSPPLEVDR